ncbi:hypothetical protein GCM10011418_37220 [Sphingobacterium alkalisoli]|nr:hypothetical protein GCM10011418_37220 [Sphingobacterium alkalisoli]
MVINDPLADAYVGMTPYGFVGNDPINYLDPDGRKIDEASSGYWYQEYMSWRGAIGQAEEDLAGLMERYESGEEGFSTPITTLKGVLAKAYQYIGLLETLASSATTYTHASGGWSILMDEVVVTGQQQQTIDKVQLNLGTANSHYRNGNVVPVRVDASKIDLSFVNQNALKNLKVGGRAYTVNLLFKNNDGFVYGKLALERLKSGGIGIRRNEYDFEIGAADRHPWFGERSTFWRNVFTVLGNAAAGPGTPYMIYFNGEVDFNYRESRYVPNVQLIGQPKW